VKPPRGAPQPPPDGGPEPRPSDPPRLSHWLLRAVLADSAAEPYLGDLLERFDDACARGGVGAARRAFRRDAAVALVRLPWRRPLVRHPHGDPMLSALAADLRHAARRLRRAPAFASLSALTLALGIGATTAVFGVAYTALLRPLPFPDAGRLVDVSETTREGRSARVSVANFADWQRASRTLQLAAWSAPSVALTGDGPAEQLAAGAVTGAFFDLLGVRPALGRFFVEDEHRTPGSHPVMVVSHAFWASRMGRDPSAI
jgi:hypothetical protein